MSKLQDVYKAYVDNGILDSSVSEERFSQMMKDEKERKNFYNYGSQTFPDYFSKDYDTFSDNVKLMFNPNPTIELSDEDIAAERNKDKNFFERLAEVSAPVYGTSAGQANKAKAEQEVITLEVPTIPDTQRAEMKRIANEQKDATKQATSDYTRQQEEAAKAQDEQFKKEHPILHTIGEIGKMFRDSNPATQSFESPYHRPSVDDANIKAASQLLLEADNTMAAAERQGEYQPGNVAKGMLEFGKSTVRTLGENAETVMSFGISDIRNMAAQKNVLDKIAKAEAYDNPESVLSPSEKILYDAIVSDMAATISRQGDISRWATAGDITGEMIPFVAEIALGRGLFGGAAKATEKAMMRTLAGSVKNKMFKRGLANLGETGIRAGQTAATVAVTPGTYAQAIGNMTQADPESVTIENDQYKLGNIQQQDFFPAFNEAFGDRFVEMYTETGGNFKTLGRLVSDIPVVQRLMKSKVGNVLGAAVGKFKNTAAGDFADKIVYNGVAGEWFEELESALYGEMKEDGTLEQFFTADQQLPMLLSFSVPAIATGGLGVYDNQKHRSRYQKAADNITQQLTNAGLTPEQHSQFATDLQYAVMTSNVEQVPTALRNVAERIMPESVAELEQLKQEYEALSQSENANKDDLKRLRSDIESNQAQQFINSMSQYVYEGAIVSSFDSGVRTQFGETKKAVEGMVAEDNALADIYNAAYDITDQPSMQDAQNRFGYQRKRLLDSGALESVADYAGTESAEDILSAIDRDPRGFIHYMNNSGMSQEQQQIFRDYINSLATASAMYQRVEDDIQTAISESDATIDAHTNPITGNTQKAVMKQDDRPVFIISGNVVMLEDGSGIDKDKSDSSIIVQDMTTGETEMVSPESIFSAEAPQSAADQKAIAAEGIRNTLLQQADDKFNGTLTFQPNEVYNVPMQDGTVQTFTAVPNEQGFVENADGTINVVDANGNVTAIPKEALQDYADQAAAARIASTEAERQVATGEIAPQAEGTTPVEPTQREYAVGDAGRFVILDDNGNPISGVIDEVADVVNGDTFTLMYDDGRGVAMSKEEFESRLVEYNGEPVNQPTAQEVEQAISVTEQSPTAQPIVETQEVQAEPQQPSFPTDANGNPAYTQAEPSAAWDKLVEDSGTPTVAQMVANTMIENLQAAQKKAEKAKPKGNTPQEIIANTQQIEAVKAGIAQELAAWKSIAGVQSARQQEATRAQREAEQAARNAKAAAFRQTTLGNVGAAPAEKWNTAPKIYGNKVTITLADGRRVSGQYVMAPAGSLTPSHNPFNNWESSEGFPTDEQGRNLNDRDYKGDVDAQQITYQMGANYDGRALDQMPINSKETGIIFSGNGRYTAGMIAAANNTDQAYLQDLAFNAQNYGYTQEQVEGMEHARVSIELDEELPYNTTTFAKFNAQEKKTQSTTNRAIANSKKISDGVRELLLREIDEYSTLDSFFKSEEACKNTLRILLENGIIAETEVPALKDENSKLFSASGKEYLTDLIIGSLFAEDTIRLLGSDKGLKQTILRASKPIIENRRLGDYALTEDINRAIRLLYEARQAGMAYGLFIRQTNAFEGAVADRYSEFEMLLASSMSEGVETFRDVLNLYNKSAVEEANGQMGMFAPRTADEIKQDVVNYYAKQQPTAAESGATETAQGESSPSSVEESNAESREQIEPTPIGESRWGKVYQWTLGKAKEAAAFLKAKRSGYLKGVFHRDGIGDIDVIWGNNSAGLMKIEYKHSKKHDDFDSLEQAMDIIDDVINTGNYYNQEDDIVFEKGNYRVVVTRDKDGQWLLTAYDFKRKEKEKERSLPNSAKGFGQNTTESSSSPVYNDGQTSDDKGTTNIPNSQEISEKPAEKQQKSAELADAAPLSLEDVQEKPIVSRVDTEGLLNALQTNGTARLSDHATPLTAEGKQEQPKNEGQFGLVSDARMAELKARLRQKMRGQMNMGIDPEIFSIGAQIAAGYIDRGIKSFADFAKVMIEEMGDAIRPYLKSFYDGARRMIEVNNPDLAAEMTPFDEVSRFDVANFDKQTANPFTTAEQVVIEQEVNEQAQVAEQKLTQKRNEDRKANEEKYAVQPNDSPLVRQFKTIKQQYPDALLLFRVGDFYEAYMEDAEKAAKILGITYTNSTKGIGMAGFPFHALDTYLPKLVRAGARVAICDPLEDPKSTKKLVNRDNKQQESATPIQQNEENSSEKQPNSRKSAKKAVTSQAQAEQTDLFGGLFENEEAASVEQAPVETRPAEELAGDSTEYQERAVQERHFVNDIVSAIKQRAETANDFTEVQSLTMREVKGYLANYDQLQDLSTTDIQELIERAMTVATRTVAYGTQNNAMAQRDTYNEIVKMYHAQPSLNARDSSRAELQQYSTPTPFGYLMGLFCQANHAVDSVLEPSAGNGALTIAFKPGIVHVNDIDDRRLANLRTLRYGQVTNQNGLLPFVGEQVDAMLTNPPFGSTVPKEFENGITISSLEGLMAINGLDAMKDDGRAAIIIGGNTEYRSNGAMMPKDIPFFRYLYSNYNVVDIINIDGKMYSRNGTSYPVRIILINGRKSQADNTFPPVRSKARAEQVKTFEELYNRIQDDIQQALQMGDVTPRGNAINASRNGERNSNRNQQDNQQHVGNGSQSIRTGVRVGAEELVNEPAQSERGESERLQQQDTIERLDNVSTADAGSNANVSGQSAESRPSAERSEDVPTGERGVLGDNSRGPAERNTSRGERLSVNLTDEKVPYPAQSQATNRLMSVVPAAQAQALAESLEQIGDVDAFLVEQLGYSSKEELFDYLAAEQIDSVALAINQMSQGNAFIIGDMTGVGKGRQGAALIRYAVNQGKTPIYFTQKATLFSDNYRDLADIGSANLRPFIIASSDEATVTDQQGNVVHKLPTPKEQERVFEYITDHGTLPPEYDYVITTYSQIQNGTRDYVVKEDGIIPQDKKYDKGKKASGADINGQKRRDAIARLSQGGIMILDESHTVGGQGGGARFMQYCVQDVGGITYLSATFAKRADNMPIYAMRTAISESGIKPQELIEAVAQGGVTLQEIMSKQLVQSGQMIRRERDFNGVTIDWLATDEALDKVQREQFDAVSEIFNEIRNFQDDYVDDIVEEISNELASTQGFAEKKKKQKDLGVHNVPFASKMYNLVNQLLFALKADAVAERVIANLQQGFKPVISFSNTMEGFLKEAPQNTPMVEMPSFSLTLAKALEGTLRYTETDAEGNSTVMEIPFSDLSPEAQSKYNEIYNRIAELSVGLSISPMDVIRMKIEDAGYSVGELTGREVELARNENGMYVVRRRTDKDKKDLQRRFNNGEVDVLMLNKSASTGISLHSSSRFADQRQRVMVFAQFQSDINDEVQMRGRIDRTGQVHRGKYEYIMSSIPAEQRLQMMFKAKLKSLDANTTSSQKSKFNEMEVTDYLNKYGDEVVWQYMQEHPELSERLGDPLGLLDAKVEADGTISANKGGKEDCAGKISRALPFLSVAEQEQVFSDIVEAYNLKIQMLNDAGENDLEITTLPLNAATISRKLWKQGTNPNSGNAFADNTYLEEVEIDVTRKPMKAEEVTALADRLSGGKSFDDWYQETIAAVDAYYAEKTTAMRERIMGAAQERAQKAKDKYIADAKRLRKQGKNALTDTEIEEMSNTSYNDVIRKTEERVAKDSEKLQARHNQMTSALRFRPLTPQAIPINLSKDAAQSDLMPSYGVFVGYKLSKDFSPSTSTAIFATLDGRRKVEIPLKEKTAFDSIVMTTTHHNGVVRTINMENWDSKTPTKTRKTGYIVTGNLLQALIDTQKGDKTHGALVSYSTVNGETRTGILMPDQFLPTDLRVSLPMSSRLNQLQTSRDKVASEDGAVTIQRNPSWYASPAQAYEIRVPKSEAKGGKFFKDKTLRQLVDRGEFETKGNSMVAYCTYQDLEPVLRRFDQLGVTALGESKLQDAPTNDELQRLGSGEIENNTTDSEKMAQHARDIAARLNLSNVEVLTSREGLEGNQATAKGFYNKRTNKITIIVPNNRDMADIEQTILHESVAHYGLRKLFGDKFDVFLSNIRENIDKEIGDKINDLATANGWDFDRAAEEYLAGMAEALQEPTVWEKIKAMFKDFLRAIGLERLAKRITDNELRYILWRSYENLKNNGQYDLFAEAADIAKQFELKVGNYSEASNYGTIFDSNNKKMSNNGTISESVSQRERRAQNAQDSRIEETAAGLRQRVAEYRGNAQANSAGRISSQQVIESHAAEEYAKENGLWTPLESANFGRPMRGGNENDNYLNQDEAKVYKVNNLMNSKGSILELFKRVALHNQLFPSTRYDLVGFTGFDGSSVYPVFSQNFIAGANEATPEEIGNYMRSLGFTPTDKEAEYTNGTYTIGDLRPRNVLKDAEGDIYVIDADIYENKQPTGDDDILYRAGVETTLVERKAARDRYERRVARGMFQSQEALQDSMLALKEAMQAIDNKAKYIEEVAGFENAYIGENRLSSVNKAEADAFANILFKPLYAEVAKLAPDEDARLELIDYMMAKHGLERNVVMAERDAKAAKERGSRDSLEALMYEYRQKDYAGLTSLFDVETVEEAEQLAQAFVDSYESNHNTTPLWEKVNAVSKAILKKSHDSGLMSNATYEDISSMYKYYIPLRGFDEKTSEEAYAYLTHKQSAFNAPIKHARGRKSKADDPFAYLESMAESTIMQGNRNKLVKQRFLNFVMNHPSDLVSVSEVWLQYNPYTEEWNMVGPEIAETDTPAEVERKMQEFTAQMEVNAEKYPDIYKKASDNPNIPYRIVEKRDLQQHQVVAKRNGRDYIITVNGNPRLAQALNGQTNPDNDLGNPLADAIMKGAESINRELSAFYTTRNPDFIVSNFLRDTLYTNVMSWVKESPRYAVKFHKNWGKCNPAYMKILYAKLRNNTLDMSNPTERAFYQFIMNGGETGYANIKDIEKLKQDVVREIKKNNGQIPVRKSIDWLAERLDEYNRAVENCARFAAFLTSREVGRDIDRSIYDAKEISVNFNKKGSGSKFLKGVNQTGLGKVSAVASGLGKAAFVFWNAAIQGTTNFGRAVKRHPAKALTAASVFFTLGLLVAGLGGDDEDEKEKSGYYDLPEYIRRTNIVFRAGDSWISIPLPIEFRAFYGLGELAMSTMSGKEHLTNAELAEAIAAQISQVLPLDMLEGNGGFSAFIPSFAKPIVEAYTNTSWTGLPIYKDTPFNKNMPEWTKAYKNADKDLVNLAAALNEATGGDEYTKGKIDINPEKIEYLLNGYFGGVFSTIDKLKKTGETIFGDREYDPRNVLLLNRVVKRGDERTESRANNNEYFRLKEEHDILQQRIRNYERDTDSGKHDYSAELDEIYSSPEFERYEIFHDYMNEINALNRDKKEAPEEDIPYIDAEIDALKAELLKEIALTRK